MASSVAPPVRSSVRQANPPSSPQTPNRFISSNLSSPGSGLRQEEDAVIIELGSRYLRAGFGGEHSPQCMLSFGPADSRRVGDYSGWTTSGRRKESNIEEWGQGRELWAMDLTDVDLGLVEDKIERAVREAYNNFLLTDVGSARLILVLPATLPHPLLSAVIATFFNRWKYSSITLLPSPTMAAVGAGVRSALVVDIGWSETTVTALCEYREIRTKRSTRSMKFLLKELGRTLTTHRRQRSEGQHPVDFELAEEFMARMTWCKHRPSEATGDDVLLNGSEASLNPTPLDTTDGQEIEIDWPTDSCSESVRLPFRLFSEPVEKVFLVPEMPSHLDDHEHSLPVLVYETLQALPSDARATCMSRIVFAGGGSGVPGLADRIISGVHALVKRYGWSAVRGKRADERRRMLGDIPQDRTEEPTARYREPLPPEKDYVETNLQKQTKEAPPTVQGEMRRIESLGAWAGASLLASMKIRGFVEIEREKFLQHGLAGAHREVNDGVFTQRTSHRAGLSRLDGDRTSWTLAGWA